jgi:transposase
MNTAPLPVAHVPLPEDINLLYLQLHTSEKRRIAAERIKITVEETNALKDSKIKNLQDEVERLRGLLRLARHTKFGAKSEKLVETQIQLSLELGNVFDEGITRKEEEEAFKESVEEPKPGKKLGRRPLPAGFERVEVIHDLEPSAKICACKHELHKIGEEPSEQLDYIPAKVRVIRHIRYKYGCKNCESTVKLAPLPLQPIPKSIATSGMLGHVLTAKYVDHIPLYRQSKIWNRMGVDISRGTMCNWVMQCGELLEPIVGLLKKQVIADNYIHADETPVQVLREPGGKPNSQSYMWVHMTGSQPNPAIVYEYHTTRSSGAALKCLEGFKGHLQSDAYVGYKAVTIQKDVTSVGCWAHARRKYTDVVKMTGVKDGIAQEAVVIIGKLYRIEEDIKEGSHPPDTVKEIRLEKAKPILDAFKKWLEKKVPLVPPKSPLGKAIQYTLRQWGPLTEYVKDGRIGIDNNVCERAIRPFAIGRRNWLFMGNPRGAKAGATIYSITETCKANNVDPYQYLCHVLAAIPTTPPEKLESLLPWNCKLPSTVEISTPEN